MSFRNHRRSLLLSVFCLQLESFVQKTLRRETPNIPSHVVHNQTAAMLEIGTNLLTRTAEQTRKLNVVEAKVMQLPLHNTTSLSLMFHV